MSALTIEYILILFLETLGIISIWVLVIFQGIKPFNVNIRESRQRWLEHNM